MISSIFYFADTEQEYLDNFNRHQVKPYTIVFCKDTRSLWKNGVRYGGSTSSEVGGQIDDIIDSQITPLLHQLNDAIQQAGDAADRAEGRLSEVSTQMDNAINGLQNAIDAEKTRLDNKVAEINDDINERMQNILDYYQNLVNNFDDNVADKIEDLLADAEWVQENMPQAEVTWNSTWDQNVDNRMLQAGYWDIDPETGEKTTKWSKLQQSVDSISTEVARVDESLSGDINSVSTQVQQNADSITSIASLVSSVDGRLSAAETSISQTPDAIVAAATAVKTDLNGNIATAKSEVIQKASEIVLTVTGVTVASDGTVNVSNTNLSQLIADNGDAISELRSDWSNANKDTKDVLEWMYSGLTTKAGESGTFNDLVSAASSGDHSAISNILSLVEKIPTYQTDPLTGELLEDEHGNYIPVTDNNGNIIYQTNPDGSFKYKAKASLTSAVDNALAGLMTQTTADYASSELFARINSDIAGLKASTGDTSALEGLVTKDNFASELSLVASDQWANTTLATKLRVPKTDDNGDPIYDDYGNPVYEDVADVLGAMRSTIEVLDGGPQVTNSIDAKVNDAISTFEQKVNDGEACTTLVNKVNNDSNVLSGLVSKVTGDSSSATMVSKVNNMTAGVVTTANLETAVAGLIARQEPIITLTATSAGAPPSGALNVYQGQAMTLPSGGIPSRPGDSLTFTGTSFNSTFFDYNYGVYHTTINTQVGPQEGFVPLKYVAGESGADGSTSNPYYAISDGEYIWTSLGLIIRINIQDLSGAVFSKVDNKIGTATSGLASRSYVTGRESALLTQVDDKIGTATASLVSQSSLSDTIAGVYTEVDDKIGTATASLVSQDDLTGQLAGVYTEVDSRIGTATAKLATKNELTGQEAAILASIANGTAEITLKGDKVTFDTGFINAVTADAQFHSVVAGLVDAKEVTTNKLDVSGTWEDEDENSYTSRTIIDSGGMRIYSGEDYHVYDSSEEEVYDANIRLADDGEGWVANRHIIWNGAGDTYIGPGDPEYDGDGIYVYNDGGVTKIKLKGEIIADKFSLNDILGDGYGYFIKYDSLYRGGLYNGGFFIGKRPADNDYHPRPISDTNPAKWTYVDWGTIALGLYGVVPDRRSDTPINRNQTIDGNYYSPKLLPGITLTVKGHDGYAYIGYTGVHNGMNYINGIAVGPAEDDDTLFTPPF